ncbi:MAG TPA: MFS transporter, partial [Micromonosporaceae bacterium]
MRLINPNFAKLFYGFAISSIGDFVFDTTLVLWIGTKLLAGKDYAPAAVSGVLVAVAVGTIVVGPVAGVFVDRWDKRRTMMVSDLIRAALVGGLVAVALLPAGTIPVGATLALIYAVVLLCTCASQFFGPSRFTLIGDIVGDDADRAHASGLTNSVMYTAAIIGPPLAAPLLFATGVYWALILNALSFLVSFTLVRAIRLTPPATVSSTPDQPETVGQIALGIEAEVELLQAMPEPAAPSGFVREFVAGFAFLVRNRPMRVVLVTVTLATLGAGALNALMVFFVTANLHVSSHWFGTLGMGEGIGGIAGSLAAGWICRRFSDVRVFAFGLLAGGIGLVVFARLDNLIAAIVVLAAIGIPLGAMNVALTPIMLRAVPRELLGRVGGVFGPVTEAASMVSALVAGWLVSTVLLNFHRSIAGVSFGPIDVVFLVC